MKIQQKNIYYYYITIFRAKTRKKWIWSAFLQQKRQKQAILKKKGQNMAGYTTFKGKRVSYAEEHNDRAERADLVKKSIVWGKTRVVLTRTYGNKPGKVRPLEGTEYKCQGTPLHKDLHPGYCTVRWDNGYTGHYLYDALEIVDEDKKDMNPNRSFAVEKWRKTFG